MPVLKALSVQVNRFKKTHFWVVKKPKEFTKKHKYLKHKAEMIHITPDCD